MKSNRKASGGRSSAPCSPSFVPFGPEWEKEVMQHRKADLVRMLSRTCRDRDGWKASHDNQVELKRVIASRPDLAERAPMVERLVSERNEARAETLRTREFMRRGFDAAAAEIAELRSAIRATIMENLHLADGDVCTLKRLKHAIGFDLDSPENAHAQPQATGASADTHTDHTNT